MKPRKLWNAEDWADELKCILCAKMICAPDDPYLTDICAEAALVLEEAMQYAAEGGAL